MFTTYSISLSFFEQWVLPLLAESGVRNVVVFADAGQLGEALLDSGAQRVGTAYQVVPISMGVGVFHPKIMLLTGGVTQRLVVSSANLTVSGQLRNLEVAAVLDSTVENHRPAIWQAAEFLRRIADTAPFHVIEALMPAIELVEPSDHGITDIEFIHNLDNPIAPRLPQGRITATVPYADGDGRALRQVSSEREVRCIVDGEHFEAGAGFFTSATDVEARAFRQPRPRVLHAKAYWNDRWALIGSPNLSAAGLLSNAASGNVETALLLATEHTMPDPSGDSWEGDVQQSATARASHNAKAVADVRAVAFQAWEEDGQIRVEGIADGASLHRYTGVGWEPYGEVLHGRVLPTLETLRPRLLRTVQKGVERIAAVHRVVELRIRRARRISGRSSEVVHTLPLDLEGVRLLEDVLGELFTLGELASGETRSSPKGVREPQTSIKEPPLTEWRPAHPGDEPRIPDIYRRSWSKDPDALLALVQAALRIDPVAAVDQLTDFDLRGEDTELSDVEDLAEEESETVDETPIPATTESVLNRYRRSFRKLLDRGVAFVEANRHSALGDLAFQTLMQQGERLVVHVEVDGRVEYLVQPEDVRRFRLRVLRAYLEDGAVIDPVCAATARYHLADLIRNESEWEPLEWERIEHLAYRHAGTLIEKAETVNREVLGLTGTTASAWLADYAARADWLGVAEHASEILRDVDFTLDPFPIIVGMGPVAPFSASPAWECLGYGMVVGTTDDDPYGIVVRAASDGPYDAHALVFDPEGGVLHEAMRRRDRVWMSRVYRPIGRGDLERAGRLGPHALSDADRTPFASSSIDELPRLIGEVAKMAAGQIVGGGA